MSEKRKLIFKEAVFNVPFLIILTVVTAVIMFLSGRSPYDIEQLIKMNMQSDSKIGVSDYLQTSRKSYEVKYYYGDNDGKELYAEFKFEGKGDTPKSTLTLYEARSGFDPGVYTIEWFKSNEYVTFTPPDTTADSDKYEQYLTSEVPLMYSFVNSYSWDGAMLKSGAGDGSASGYSLLGIRLFVWDYTDDGVSRENFIWGIGGNPQEMYSYIRGSEGEYKLMRLK